MTVDLILHGVPNGQDVWGVSNDSHYFSTFYIQKNEKEYMSIETRKVDDKAYCYYNYLRYSGVTANDNRAGSYLGITLRIDAYYKDIVNMYYICEVVYKSLFDILLAQNGNGIKFNIARFNDVDSKLKELNKKVISLIQLTAKSSDFVEIDGRFFQNNGQTPKAFLLDCTLDNVYQAIIKYGKIEISKHFPSANEKAKMKSVEDQYSATITQKDSDIQALHNENSGLKVEQKTLQNNLQSQKNENQELRQEIQNKDSIIKQNEKYLTEANALRKQNNDLQNQLQIRSVEIEKLKKQLSQQKDTQTVSDLIKQIKEPLITLAEVAGRQLTTFPPSGASGRDKTNNHNSDGDQETHKKGNVYNWKRKINWKIVIVLLFTAILSVGIYCAYKFWPTHKVKAKTEQTNAYIQTQQEVSDSTDSNPIKENDIDSKMDNTPTN